MHTLYLLACQVRVTVGNSDVCCVSVTSFGRCFLLVDFMSQF